MPASLKSDVVKGERTLVSIKEAAARHGVSKFTIGEWIDKRRLEAFRVEGERRIYVATY